MHDFACEISFAPHFTFLRKEDLQLETALTASSGKQRGKVVVWIEWWSKKDVHLPDSVTHPSSLMTCGCGLSVFISSSSDLKSRLSDSGALAI